MKRSASGASPAPERIPVDSPDYRPRTYFGIDDLQVELLGRVKGVARREVLRASLDAGRIAEIPDEVKQAALPEAERQAAGRVHPIFMGGEYLPTVSKQEIEIARIRIESTTFDVTSLYARQGARRIHYRVVDEYGGDTVSGPAKRTSAHPLTMGELIEFLLGAWDLCGVLEMNYEGDLESMLGFFVGESEFYPCFDEALRKLVRERFGTDESECDDE